MITKQIVIVYIKTFLLVFQNWHSGVYIILDYRIQKEGTKMAYNYGCIRKYSKKGNTLSVIQEAQFLLGNNLPSLSFQYF